mmetsp:Transcript_97887/g.255116  ORF Transcript_97887/g.255116 Transcript_97887/m.255116 type:complete len:639 (+) Transcript_97887:1351-3267(+)
MEFRVQLHVPPCLAHRPAEVLPGAPPAGGFAFARVTDERQVLVQAEKLRHGPLRSRGVRVEGQEGPDAVSVVHVKLRHLPVGLSPHAGQAVSLGDGAHELHAPRDGRDEAHLAAERRAQHDEAGRHQLVGAVHAAEHLDGLVGAPRQLQRDEDAPRRLEVFPHLAPVGVERDARAGHLGHHADLLDALLEKDLFDQVRAVQRTPQLLRAGDVGQAPVLAPLHAVRPTRELRHLARAPQLVDELVHGVRGERESAHVLQQLLLLPHGPWQVLAVVALGQQLGFHEVLEDHLWPRQVLGDHGVLESQVLAGLQPGADRLHADLADGPAIDGLHVPLLQLGPPERVRAAWVLQHLTHDDALPEGVVAKLKCHLPAAARQHGVHCQVPGCLRTEHELNGHGCAGQVLYARQLLAVHREKCTPLVDPSAANRHIVFEAGQGVQVLLQLLQHGAICHAHADEAALPDALDEDSADGLLLHLLQLLFGPSLASGPDRDYDLLPPRHSLARYRGTRGHLEGVERRLEEALLRPPKCLPHPQAQLLGLGGLAVLELPLGRVRLLQLLALRELLVHREEAVPELARRVVLPGLLRRQPVDLRVKLRPRVPERAAGKRADGLHVDSEHLHRGHPVPHDGLAEVVEALER